jgi:3-oxoacyl-(acyl-carrier-protein) synthase
VRDLAITGAGLLTPIGGNVAASWEAFRAGRLGVVRAPASTGWDGWWAEIPGAYLAGRLDPATAKRTDRFVQYALIAAGEALSGAALTPDPRWRRAASPRSSSRSAGWRNGSSSRR